MELGDTYLQQSNWSKAYDKGKGLKAPSHNSYKGLSWFKKMSKHIAARYYSNYGIVGCGGFYKGRSIPEFRLYARGEQANDKYKQIVDDPTRDKQTGKTELYNNISWDNVKILPKFLSIVMSKMNDVKYGVVTQANDPKANLERTLKIKTERMLRDPRIKGFIKETGLKPEQKTSYPEIESMEDLNFFEKMGGIRLDHEILMKDTIDSTYYVSNFDVIDKMLKKDLIEIGIMASEDYIERATGIVKKKYIDPQLLVARNSKYPDCRDIDYAGYIESKTISQIRMESDLTEMQLYQIAKKYKKHGINRAQEFSSGLTLEGLQEVFRNTGSYPYDDFKIDVLKYYVISAEVPDIDLGEDVPPPTGNAVQNVYRCHYVMGTDYVYDFGKEYGIVRQGKPGAKITELPIKIYKSLDPSVVEKCIAHVDDIQMAILKKRSLLRKIPPGPRIALNQALLENQVTIGDKTYDPLEITELFLHTGVFIYNERVDFGDYDERVLGKPMEPIPLNIAEDYRLFTEEIVQGIDMIRQVTGVNPVADGTSVNGDMLKGVQEGMQMATNSALQPYMDDYKMYSQQCVAYTAKKWQVAALAGDIDISFKPFDNSIIKTFKLTKRVNDYDYGIHIVLVPNLLQKREMIAHLRMKQSEGKLSAADMFFAEQMIEQGDLRKFQLFISKAEDRREKLLHQRNLEIQAAQGEASSKAAQVAENERRKTIEVETKGQIAVENVKGEWDLKKTRLENEGKLAQVQAKNAEETKKSIIEKHTDKALFNEKRATPVPSESNDGLS